MLLESADMLAKEAEGLQSAVNEFLSEVRAG
jgi:hypothetical protein